MKKHGYIIIIILALALGIVSCIITMRVGTTETIGNENYVDETVIAAQNTKNETVENEIVQNTIENITTNVVENATNEVHVENTITPNNIKNAYEADLGTTDNKQEAIELVKKTWGEDSSVTFRCDSVSPDGKYIVAVVSLDTASVKNYFKVDLNTKTVEVDY